jgi:preprotein translocase subunit SecF
MGAKQFLVNAYDVHQKKLMVFSFLVLIACIISLGVGYARTGELFQKGVSLKGGITLTVPVESSVDIHSFEEALSGKYPSADISVREITEGGTVAALIVEASDISPEDLKSSLPELGVPLVDGEYSIESMGSSLGQRFFIQTIKAVIFAFIMVSIVIFLTFRALLPSFFVVFSAASGIISTLAVVNLLGMKLSAAGIAALLMLIGYSVDANILLTTKVLKRKSEGGTIIQRTVGAMRTGLTMTLCALASSMIGLAFIRSDVISQIMVIVSVGLLFDLIYTWFQNAWILRWYMVKNGSS